MGRRTDPRFAHCYRADIQERDYSKELTNEEARRACDRRRRIEDIREAARLEREALDEVWEQ